MENTVEKSADLTVQEAVNTWNHANPEKLIKKFLPDLADQVYIRAYPNSDQREYDIVRFDEEDFLLYDFFLKYKFNGDKTKCDAFVVKLISAHEEKKAKVSEDLMTEQKKAEAEEIKANKEGLADLPEWVLQLRMTPKGAIAEDLFNYELILENENLNIRKNDLTKQIEFDIPSWLHRTTKNPVLTDDDSVMILSYINDTYRIKSKNTLDIAIESVAAKHSYNPLRDYFKKVEEIGWDGVPRLEGLMKEVLNVNDEFYEETDGIVHNFADEVLKILMTAAYRRAMSDTPVKYDQGVLLIGPQGRCKSTFIKRLAAGFGTDSLTFSDITGDDKKAIEKLEGKLFAEIPEFYFSNKRRDVDAIKSFMSKEEDRFRRAFGKRVETLNRLTVFVMTSNDESHNILTDSTGSRRWLILECGKDEPNHNVFEIMTPEFVIQLWAELIDKEQHGGKSIAEETSIAIIPHSGLWNFANNKATENLKTDSREADVLHRLNIPLPKNWNSWSDVDRREYLADPSQSKINAQETQPRQFVSKKCVWCDIMGKNWQDMGKSDEFGIENICNKIGLIKCTWADGKKRFPGGLQYKTYWRIPSEEEWNKSHPGRDYPFVYDEDNVPDYTKSEAFFDNKDKVEQAERKQGGLEKKLQEIGIGVDAAFKALEQGDTEAVKQALESIKSVVGPIATTEEDFTELL